MSAYTDAVVRFEPVDGIRYRQVGPTHWELGRKGSGWWFTVADGTLFEVSIPRLLRWAFNPHDKRYLKAAALHDELLKAGVDRITAAAAFNQALLDDGVGKWERFKMTAAVAFYKFA